MRLRSTRVVFGGTAQLHVAPGYVDIEGAHIVAVGTGEPPADERETSDFGDRLISPAFVNAHTHHSLHSLRGLSAHVMGGNVVEDVFYRVESKLTAQDVRAFVRMGAYESLLCGVGLVWDHYFFGDAVADAIADTGLAAVIAPTTQDIGGPCTDQWPAQLESTARLAEDSRPNIYAAFGPHATDTVSDELWVRIAHLADELGIPVHAHLAQLPDEVARVRARHETTPWGMLEKLGVAERVAGVFAHGIYIDRNELARIGKRHTLVSCPYSQLLFAFPARVDEWERAGVRWTVATDCAASNDSMSLRKELRFVAGVRTVGTSFGAAHQRFLGQSADAAEVWEDRTRRYEAFAEAADAKALLHRVWGLAGGLHPNVRAGVLEAGALANVVVWDLDHPAFWPAREPLSTLALGDVDAAIHAMYVAGRPVGQAGDFHRSIVASDEYREHRLEATARLERLLH